MHRIKIVLTIASSNNKDANSARIKMSSTLDKVKQIMSANNYVITTEREIQSGTQLKTATGVCVNIYDTGTVLIQGKNKNAQALRELIK